MGQTRPFMAVASDVDETVRMVPIADAKVNSSFE